MVILISQVSPNPTEKKNCCICWQFTHPYEMADPLIVQLMVTTIAFNGCIIPVCLMTVITYIM